MKNQTERFREIVRWLKVHRGVKTLTQLSGEIGVPLVNLSRANTGARGVGDDLLETIRTHYDCPFSLQWMRGEDMEPEQPLHPDIVGAAGPGATSDAVLRELLAMREDVKKELELLRQERQHLQDVAAQLLQCMPAPHIPRQYEENVEQPLPVAAEDKK